MALLFAGGACACGRAKHTTTPPSTESSTTTSRTTAPAPPTTQTSVATVSTAPPGATLSVSPHLLTVGAPVTITGTACPPPDLVQAYPFVQPPLAPAADGSWTITAPLPDLVMLGTQTFGAQCVEPSQHVAQFQYPEVEVKVQTRRRLRLSTTSAPPGGQISVADDGACPQADLDAASVWLATTDDPYAASISDDAEAATGVDDDAHWSLVLTVPVGTRPGTYILHAACFYSRAYTAWYPTVPITIT